MIKRRSRPQSSVREKSPATEEPVSAHVSEPDNVEGDDDEDKSLPCVVNCDRHISGVTFMTEQALGVARAEAVAQVKTGNRRTQVV